MNKTKFIFLVFIILSIVILASPLIFLKTTSSYFYDLGQSTGNSIVSASLVFSLRDFADNLLSSPHFDLSDVMPGDEETKEIRIKKEGSIDFDYMIWVVKTGGNRSFCDKLKLEAKLDGVSLYDNNLSAFTFISSPTVITDDQDDWTFTLGLSDDDPVLQAKNCQFSFSFYALDPGDNPAYYDGAVLSNQISSGDWTPPESNALALNSYQSSPNFLVNYQSQDSISQVDKVWLYYQYEAGGWILYDEADFTPETPHSGSFSFTAGQGDGQYQFFTIAVDTYGNIENDTNANGVLETFEYPSADTSTILDTLPPETTLTVDSGLVVSEQMEDNSFEASPAFDNWQQRGSVSQVGANQEFEANPYDGSLMARVGDTGDSGNEVWLNGLGQSINSGAKTLSFWYNFYSYDDLPFDAPGFSVVINGQEVFNLYAADIWNYYSDTANYDSQADTNHTCWQKSYIDLTSFETDFLGISFYAGNTNTELEQSWVYLDKVTTTEVVAKQSTVFNLTSTDNKDPSPETKYLINNDPEQTGSTFTLAGYPAGEHTIKYWSVDAAANQEAYNTLIVFLDINEPEAIADLEISALSDTSVSLSWTVPDDSGQRTASYDIRYWPVDLGVCDAADWSLVNTNKVSLPPVPRFPGEIQDFVVANLEEETDYCFAIKTCDTALNCSDISTDVLGDIVFVTTLAESLYSAQIGEVVINELMWTGSSASTADEWIELKNLTDEVIDLTGWVIEKAGLKDSSIALDGSIQANGYFLISHFLSSDSRSAIADFISVDQQIVGISLLNDGEELVLKDADDNVIDQTPVGVWPAGDNSKKWSMERNETPGDGSDPLSWHTCEDALTSVEYWDKDALEQGTPGGENRSDNELKIEFNLSADSHSVGFSVYNTKDWQDLNYQITYESLSGDQGIIGNIILDKENKIKRNDLVLGVCSSQGKVCIYHRQIKNLRLKIVLKTQEKEKILEKNLIK